MAIQKFSEYKQQQENVKQKQTIQKFSDYTKENNINYKVNKILPTKNSTGNKLGATLGNAGLLLGKGAVKSSEGILDFLNDMTAKTTSKAFELIGRDDLAQSEKESRQNFIERDLTSELGKKTGITNQITKNEQNGSLLKRDNLGGQVVQAIGGQIPTLAIGALTGTGGLNNAINTSKMGTIAKIGTTALLNAPTTATLAARSYGGALEEAYLNGATESEATKYAIGSTATEIATEWITGGIPGTNGKGGLDALADKGIDKISNQLVKDLTKYGYKIVGEGVEEGIAEILSPILKNATYSNNEKIDWNNVINSAIIGGITGGILETPTTINNVVNNRIQNNNVNSNNNVLPRARTQNSMSEGIQNDINNQINENMYQYIKSNNDKINNLRKSAVETGQFQNNEKTTGVMNVAEKLISDKNYNIVFDNTISNENGNMVNAQITTLENGETEIRLNPNSDRTAEFLLIHEVSHGIKTQKMIDLVNDYASKNSEFNQTVKSLEQLYGKDLTSEEVFADVCGQLFGNQEFIMNLSTTKPSLFRRIYNKIVELANKITGNSNEALFIRDLKNKWENAYRTQENNLDETKYMITGLKGVKNGIKADSDNQWALDSYNKAQEMLKRKYTNEEIRKKTNWFQDNEGNWKFEISDKDAVLSKKIDKNAKYRLSEIFNHPELYEMYPNIKKIKVKFKNISTFNDQKVGGQYVPLTNTIEVNNTMLDKNNANFLIKKTLLHEIQHNIQAIEKFNSGYKGKEISGYFENLGEIEAKNTENRILMNEVERFSIAPESSKKMPIHPDIQKILDNPNSKTTQKLLQDKDIANLVNKIYNEVGGTNEKSNINVEKSNKQTNLSSKKTQNFLDRLGGRKQINFAEELDNSSFSYSKNDTNWQEHLEKNYKATGTRTKFNEMKSNITEQIDNSNVKQQVKKAMNPLEISKITKQDSNTTPILPKVKVSTGDGESKFASNIRNKTDMLNQNSKDKILSSEDVLFYEKVTNQESLEKAFERLNKGGKSETENWLRKESENATSVDVAEGWILLKQYQDSIAKETDINTKNELNRSMVEVAKKLREIGTKAGQTVQAFNILNRLTPEGMVYYAQSELSEAYEKMSKNKTKEWIDSNRDRFELTPEETQFIMDTMQEVQQMEDGYDKRVKLAEIQKVMTDKLPPERGAGIKSWMRISMLFNPKTQVRNVMGNAVIAPVNSFSDLFASVVDKQIAKKTGIRTTGKTSGKNYAEGFKTGIYQSYNDFKKGINTRNMQGNRFEVNQGKSFNDNSVIGKNLNKVDSLLSFMLDAGDRGFYEASFTNSINNQMILNNTTEVTQDMIDIATSEALSRTWQDNNNYTKFVLQTRNSLNKINIKGYGLGDVLIPFAKTPANLTKAIVDYSPLGMINAINSGKNLKNSLSNGQYNAKLQHQFVQNLGKATAGTMLYILGYALAKAGVTSGESDEDKDVKDFMKNTLGVSSYSIKIGNKTFTYDWAQPIAAPLSIMANIVNKQKEGATLTENIISSLDTAGNILLEQSFMESINTVLNNNEGIVTGIQEAILELPSRAIPTLMKQIVDLTDDTQRTSFEYDKPLKTAVNKVKAKIPGLSKTLSPVVDTMGREVQRYGGKNNIFNVFLNPANVNTENISESAQEIYRVYKSTGDKTVMPRVIPYYFDEKGVKRTLNSKERSEFQKISGTIIEENIANLLNNTNYVNMSDIDKSAVLNNLVNYAYNKARYEMFGTEMSNQYNKVNEWTTQGGTVSDYYANKEECDYSLENPKKYKTMTSLGLSYKDYEKYSKDISDLKKQYNDTNSKKDAIWKYIQNQQTTKVQKILLFNLCGGYSISNYKTYMFNYINNQNITKNEKQEIWKYLYE